MSVEVFSDNLHNSKHVLDSNGNEIIKVAESDKKLHNNDMIYDIIYYLIGLIPTATWIYIRIPEITNLWSYLSAVIIANLFWPVILIYEGFNWLINSPIAHITFR